MQRDAAAPDAIEVAAMRRAWAILASAVFLPLAPGVVAGVIPWWLTRWAVQAAFPGLLTLRVLGGLAVAAGILGVLDCVARFALHGLGTPAPFIPTRHLVVGGAYRHVRNPMYLAVIAMVLGQAALFASAWVLAYGLLLWLAFHAFVRIYEEPTLRRTFGAEYAAFCANVPRWVPRLRAWRGSPAPP